MPVLGRYTLGEEVARGGAGAVYRARGPDGTEVAVKVLLTMSGAAPQRVQRALGEARALLRLDHPGVVRLLDVGQETTRAPYLVLEWVEGESLATRLQRQGPLSLREAADLVARVAAALEHCHQRGVVHRDIKPGNVLLRASDGAPLLTDFGLALDLEQTTRLTREGGAQGTPGYWAPEQAAGRLEEIGPRTDVWGLGALLHALLTGEPPAPGEDLAEALTALRRPIPPPSAARPEVPPALDAVCARCLAREPAGRFAGPGEVERALRGWLVAPAGPGAARRRVRAALGLIVLGGLGAGAWPLRAWWRADRAQRLLPQVEEQALAGDLDGARRLAERAVELDPGSWRVWAARGSVRMRQRDWRGALGDFQAGLEREENAGLHLCRGVARVELGETDAARPDLERALELDPRLADAWLARGTLRSRTGDPQGALADFERALELRPGWATALASRGCVREMLGDVEGALMDLERALALVPDDPDALGYRSAARERQGDRAGALRDLERAVQRDPGNPENQLNRARLLALEGRWREAAAACDQALLSRPGYARALAVRGRARAELGELQAGLADLDRALALDPRRAGHWSDRAALRLLGGDLAGAAADAERTLALDPTDGNAHGVLGMQALQRGEMAVALRAFDRAIEGEPRGHGHYRNRGVVRFQTGDLPGAVADLERCLELAPDDPDAPAIRENLARLRALAERRGR